MKNKILQNILIDFIKPLSTIDKKEEIINSLKNDKWIITKFNTYPALGKCINIEKDDKTYFIENIPLSIFQNDDILEYIIKEIFIKKEMLL